AERLCIHPADRSIERIFGDDAIPERRNEADLRIEKLSLGIEHIERRALSDLLFLAHTRERNLIGVDGRLGGTDRRPRGLQDAPVRNHIGMNPKPRVLNFFLELIVRLLGLAYARGDAATLIERHVHAPNDRGRVLFIERRIARYVGRVEKAEPLLILRL